MRHVRIQEFSLSTSIEYRRPVVLGDAKLDSVARALALPPCGDFLNPADISITKQNELFSYSLSVPMFNEAASVAVNSQGVTVSFKQGRTKDHLELMRKLTLAALDIAKVEETKRSLVSFNAHAVFDPPSDFVGHMKRFTELAQNVVSGGLVLVVTLPEIDGELRYASEKSLVYPDSLFFAANAVCQRDLEPELFETLAARFEAAAALEEIDFPRT
jgi:hypothetical protein